MKQFYTFIPALIFSATIITFISTQRPDSYRDNNSSTLQLFNSDGQEIDDAVKYDLMRMRDPATGKIPDNIRQLELQYAKTLPGYFDPENKNQNPQPMTVNFQSRGPWNVGGRTRAFAVDVTNPQKLLAGSTSGGMWSSTDGGTSWTQTWGIAHQSTSCIAQDTRTGKTNTWYVGTGEGYGQSASDASGSAYYLGNGLYKSTDGGQTWSSISSTAANSPNSFIKVWQIVWNVAINPADTSTNGTVYAATYAGIWKSTNGGTSWSLAQGVNGNGAYFTDVAVSKSGVVYASLSQSFTSGNGRGVWRSPDGVNWTNITPANFDSTYGRIRIGISPADENQVYFWGGTTKGKVSNPTCVCDTDFLGNIECNSLWKYKYIDSTGAGTHGKWQNLSQNLPRHANGFTGPHDKEHTQGGYDMVVKVHPKDTAVVFLGGTNLYRSDDGFTTPNNIYMIGGYKQNSAPPFSDVYLNHHPDQHEVVFDTTGSNFILYSTNDGGLHKSLNGMSDTVTWTKLNNGYLTSMFYTVAMDHSANGDSTLVGGLQDNNSYFTNSLNPQSPWVKEFFGDGSYCAIDNGKNNYYLSIQSGKVQKMQIDAAGNVSFRRRIDPRGGKGYQFINPFALDPNNQNRMYLAGGKNLWRNDSLNYISLYGAASPLGWDSISQGWTMFPDTVPTGGATITAVAVSKNPANTVYYGTSNQKVYRLDNANSGTPTAIDITSSQFPTGAYVSCVAIDPTDARKVMVAFSNYNAYSIFYTTRADSSAPPWMKVAGNIEQYFDGSGNGPSVRWLSIMPVADGTVYFAATSTGLYATDSLPPPTSNTSPVVWTMQGANTIGNSICDMVDFRTTDGLVAVATHSRGIFSANVMSRNDVLSVHDITAQNFGLVNYPNPFSNSTFISFSLNKNEKVKMTIYDVSGKFIKTLCEKEFSSGENKVEMRSENLSTGIYYCVMKAGEAVATRKIILVK